MNKKGVILLSGGLDSATCLAMAKRNKFDCYCLSVDYGQKHNAELTAAKNIAKYFNVVRHEVVALSLSNLGGSALTDKAIDVPDFKDDGEIPVTYVPARNTVLLSIALAWAEILNADGIFVGANAVDYSGYPDCRPEYIQAFQHLTNLATKKGVEGGKIHIFAPLIHLSKSDIIRLGHDLGVDFSMTISCYRATEDGSACGTCDSCVIRKKGFSEAGVTDTTRYV